MNRNIVAAIVAAVTVLPATGGPLVLKYDRPARYFEEALVIGNGNIGAIVYNDQTGDRLNLNDITLWTGEPDTQPEPYTVDAWKALPGIREALFREDYREADKLQKQVQGRYTNNYQPLGTLKIDYLNRPAEVPKDYRRQLDIGASKASSSYTVNGYPVTTEYFASAPDSVIVVRVTTADPAGFDAVISLDSQLPHSVKATGNELSSTGYAAYRSYPSYTGHNPMMEYDPDRGTRFNTLVKAINDGGTVTATVGDRLKAKGVKTLTLLVTNATSFNGFDKDPAKEGRDYLGAARRRLDLAAAHSYDELEKRHKEDYKRLFDRVEVDFGETTPDIAALPTDVQLLNYTDKGQANPDLEELYFQYGRYLLISCSRTPEVPANLQGLWNESILPPWSSNYTTNINVEENYWPVEVTNLGELHAPLLGFIHNLSGEKTGQRTASNYYGVNNGGWALGHNSDIWALTNPVGLRGGDPSWANWNMGGAWIASHLWEHYLFSQDKDRLRRDYPVLKGAALFCLDWLIEKDGELITAPGTSPENTYLTADGYRGATMYGGTADLAFVRQCLMDTRDAAKALGTDKELRKRIDRTLKKLHPYKIGKNDRLQEWYHDFEDAEPGHRHQTHLYGIFPGRHITPVDNPELIKAAGRTLELKGDKTTGWSTGWRVNLFARMLEPEKAYHYYRTLLKYVSPDGYRGKDARRGGGTYPNLLDAHSPFQIDGNFGGTAGVAEMLIQSTPETISLLPALPGAWKNGSMKGLRARGGFEVSMTWRDGKVTTATVKGQPGNKTTVKANGKSRKVTVPATGEITLNL